MKFICPCGAKYAFDVTPEMVQRPVSFVCQTCGQDSSAEVNASIRAEFPAQDPVPVAPLMPSPPAAQRPQVRVNAPAAIAVASPATLCPKHLGQRTVEHCVVCGKPICPQCMKLFGYVCSPLCRQKADLSGIVVPEFELQNSIQLRKFQRKLMTTIFTAGGALALVIGLYVWYLLVGSQPRPVYSVQFANAASSGKIHLVGRDQIVFIHGSTLARHDIRSKKAIWSVSLVNRTKILAEATASLKEIEDEVRRAQLAGKNTERFQVPSIEQLTAELERQYVADLDLHVRGEKIWVAQPDKLVRHGWADGQPAQEVPVSFGFGGAELQGDDLVALRDEAAGQSSLTRVSLVTGNVTTEKFRSASSKAVSTGSRLASALGANGSPDLARALDPDRIAAAAQRLPIQGRLALPATVSIQQGQNRLLQEMDEMDNGPVRSGGNGLDEPHKPDLSEHVMTLATKNGPVEFSRQMIEERIVERTAMKAPPKRSVLDGPVNANNTLEAANEILNEIQRTRGTDTVREDESLFRVAVRLPGKDGAPEWKSELTGPPAFHPLKTVNLVIAGKKVIALDTSNRKLWEHTASYNIEDSGSGPGETGSGNIGTIAERDGTVFITDPGVLTALDAATGNVRWRFPSVGVSGLFFDDKGMMYVNSTTADPDSIKFSKQIDVSKSVNSLVVKLNPADGSTVWRAQAMGHVSHVSGKYLYTLESSAPEEYEDAQGVLGLKPSADSGHLSLRRIHAGNGGTKWEYQQKRGPLDVEIVGNSIQIVFPREVQVLRFMSW